MPSCYYCKLPNLELLAFSRYPASCVILSLLKVCIFLSTCLCASDPGVPARVYCLLANGKFLNEHIIAPAIQPSSVKWNDPRSVQNSVLYCAFQIHYMWPDPFVEQWGLSSLEHFSYQAEKRNDEATMKPLPRAESNFSIISCRKHNNPDLVFI